MARRAVTTVVLTLLVAIPHAIRATDDVPKASFGVRGVTTTDLGGRDFGQAIALQADNRIIVVGTSITGNSRNIALVRYNADGTPDTTFGTGGTIITDLGGWDFGQAIALQADNRIIVVGTSITGNSRNIALVRYNADGTPDTTFGTGGTIITDLGGWDSGQAIALQADNRIIVAGTRSIYSEQVPARGGDVFPHLIDFMATRYNADGTPDTTFGTGGTIITDLGGWDFGQAIALQADNRIIVVGTSITGNSRNIALVRYNADGTPDTTFGTGGTIITDLGGWDFGQAIALQADNRIIVVGTSITGNSRNIALVRYNADGTPDTTFGTGGTIITDLGGWDFGQAIALQADNRIIVVGTSITGNSRNIALVRYNADGTPDTTFGTGGTIITDLGGWDSGQAIALQPDNRIIVAGTSNDDIALVHYGLWNGAFFDDDANAHEPAIEDLAARGIVSACDARLSRYCPSEPVTRAQMAVILARVLGDTPDSLPRDRFSDVAEDSSYARHVAYIAARGITLGCDDSPPRFCPDEPVTRAQAALFLVRTFDLEGISDEHAGFVDIGNHPVADAIEVLYSAGITRGCDRDPLRFCPDDPVGRDQMASFISRSLGR